MFQKLNTLIKDIKAEFIKVSWPKKEQTIRNTYIVFIIIIIMSLFFGVLNIALGQIVQLIF